MSFLSAGLVGPLCVVGLFTPCLGGVSFVVEMGQTLLSGWMPLPCPTEAWEKTILVVDAVQGPPPVGGFYPTPYIISPFALSFTAVVLLFS